jgi:hypothetical protein
VAIQGYYQAGNTQPLMDTSGTAVKFQTLISRFGTLSGSLEAYGSSSRLAVGENFLELRGAPWMGQHWTFTAGDFHTSSALVEFPFTNIYTPEIMARGVRIEATHENRQYTFFAGEETLTAGPRVPFRILIPQTVVGATALRKLGSHFWIGGRFLQLASSAANIAAYPSLFPPGRDAGLVRTASAQALYVPQKQVKLYAEASRPVAIAAPEIVSTAAGIAVETTPFTLRANYVTQGMLYLPLAGYHAGDRRGPFAEARLRPWKKLELFGSANAYRNNLENDPRVSQMNTSGASGGVSASLPGNLWASGQISSVRFTSTAPAGNALDSRNRQLSATLSRVIRRHSLHLTLRDIRLEQTAGPERQRSTEVEDMFQVKQIFVGGGVRWQQSAATERRNSLFYRGSLQGRLGRLTAFANIELGKDLPNATVFSTDTYSTTVVGGSIRLIRDWNVQAEVFRNRMNIALNPENLFVLQNGGEAVNLNLASLNQWSLFFRLTKHLKWGRSLPAASPGQPSADVAPLVGTVVGIVRIKTLSEARPAAGIPITLDGGRSTTTGSDGAYRFADVPEGLHQVALAAAELPADLDPGGLAQTHIAVRARRLTPADFEVLPLLAISGSVASAEGVSRESILIRLLPGSRYTTTDADGRFAFYNVREGDYELALDEKTLPENAVLRSPAIAPVAIRFGAPVAPVDFSFAIVVHAKPVRKVLDKQ